MAKNKLAIVGTICSCAFALGLGGEIIRWASPNCLHHLELCQPDPAIETHHVETVSNTIALSVTHEIRLEENMRVVDGTPSIRLERPFSN